MQIIKMLYEILMGLQSLIKFVEANKNEAWFQNSSAAFTKIREAKSEEEYKQAAKDLRDLWGGVK